MKRVYLDNNWSLFNEKVGTLSAIVPGCAHTDLLRHGLIEDPYWRDNSEKCRWVENEDFTYTCTFDAEEAEHATILFEGLDTYCTIFLNGEEIGATENMFIPHEFAIGGKLKAKDNLLEVKFRSAVKEMADQPLGTCPFSKDRLRTRRTQCTYGWDWVERFVTCGIFRPVSICYGNDMGVDSVYVLTESIDRYSAQLYIELEMKNFSEGGLVHIEIVSPDGSVARATDVYCKEPKIVRRLDIARPELWYPIGYGEHPLYTLRVTVGEEVFEETFGIRTVKILQLVDEKGSEYEKLCRQLQADEIGQGRDLNEVTSGFQLLVNGVRIACLGANWVPCEPFASEESDEKLEYLVDLAAEMNLNMLRVWGGGLFEKKSFYDACDRAGILVTQDFLMACGRYPEKEEWFLEHLRKEAEYAAKFLRNHPCLVWWTGDNENAVRGSDADEDYTGRSAALEAIGPVLNQYDHGRQFLPSSPYGGNMYSSRTVGTTHNTGYLGYINTLVRTTDCTGYQELLERYIARFVAEDPAMGACSRKSALRYMTMEDLYDPEQTIMRHHTRTDENLIRPIFVTMSEFAVKIFGEPTDPEDRYFKYKYLQHEWVRVVMENMRRHVGFDNGIIFWMYNDCWPATIGWSFVDYYCVPKASFYSFRRCARPQLASVTCRDGVYHANLSNCREESVSATGHAYLCRKSEGMKVIDEKDFAISVGEYASAAVSLDWATDPDLVPIIDVDLEGYTDRAFYNHGKPLLASCPEELTVVSFEEDSVTLKANSYLHVVELEGDCIFSEDYFSMMPGEEKTVTWKKLKGFEDDSFTINAYTLK